MKLCINCLDYTISDCSKCSIGQDILAEKECESMLRCSKRKRKTTNNNCLDYFTCSYKEVFDNLCIAR